MPAPGEIVCPLSLVLRLQYVWVLCGPFRKCDWRRELPVGGARCLPGRALLFSSRRWRALWAAAGEAQAP